ncbi:hypothetical protein GA0074692_5615 [Micromonospora pallida]|uniref:Peptidase n=1 Tax=Micromonospora pallida TaxID=145854 RepID=A0A1C6TEB7_9ACTN|nr:hypothetical protein GA0074692_5615 [Micromonospora pallida]
MLTLVAAAGTPAAADRGSPTRSPSPQPAPEVKTGVGIRLLDAPANRREDSRAHRYIVDHVAPGTTIKRRIVVENKAEMRRPVAVYPAAAEVGPDGFVFAPGRTPNELTSWISVERGEVPLNPDEEKTLWVTIAVPRKASAGERYGVVWAEVPGTGTNMVRNVGRAGIRIYLSVGQGGEPPSAFEVAPLVGGRDADGRPTVTAEVRNTGQRALDLAGELSLADGPGGLSAGPVKTETVTLGLGGTATVRIPLDKRLPDGPWAATLALASGWTKRTVSSTVTFSGKAATAPASGERDRTVAVLTGGLLVSALVLATFLGLVHRRRNRAMRPPLRAG